MSLPFRALWPRLGERLLAPGPSLLQPLFQSPGEEPQPPREPNRPGQGQTLYHDNALTLHLGGVLRLSSVPHKGMFWITGSRHPYGCLDFFCFVWKVSPKVGHKSQFQEESYPVQLDLFWWHHRISAMSQVGVQRCPQGLVLDPSSLQLSLSLVPSLFPLPNIENFWPKQKQGE